MKTFVARRGLFVMDCLEYATVSTVDRQIGASERHQILLWVLQAATGARCPRAVVRAMVSLQVGCWLLAGQRTHHLIRRALASGPKRLRSVATGVSTWNLREPGSGLRAVAWAWERCSKPAQGLSLEHSCASAGSAAARPSPSSCAPFRVWHPKGTEDARRPLSTVSGRLFRIRLGGARGSRCAALAGRARLRTQEEPRALVQMHVLRA